MENVTELFGAMVFDDKTMRQRLAPEVYEALRRTITEGKRLDTNLADAVASAMKDWAIELGATHYTHWFQPMTGITAEKHDSFIAPAPDGRIIMEFSGKELIKGESDASSFPSGGLRATFEARGYTAWDPSSYAFIKENTLCIPTAFCSYGGEALDKKTPLLRSMEAVSKQAMRIVKLFGHEDVKRVITSVGPEQEYFLVDRAMFEQRRDLIFTGRTLFGAKPPKGQEMDDHYFGAIKPRVAAFMADLDRELWKLGILAKTEHNEAAPAQHELAPIYTTTNIAADHNQLTMEMMQRISEKHGLMCLLHEKPFAGVNGSGKHNNWSLSTDTGINLLSPGETPYDNAQFLLFLVAVIQAVDDYQDLLRLSVATASNDHRLGANEAPPAVISIFLGDELTAILDAIETDTPYNAAEKEQMKLGVHLLPRFQKDTTDRNRTSPMAFTGNKFEFRMLGSSNSISCANVMLNAAVAESLRQFADRLEGAEDFETALHDLMKETVSKHKRIIFNGNGYDDAWIEEATQQRGLLNLPTTPDALPYLLAQKNIEMLGRHKIFNEVELHSRYEILMENYCKTVTIEALTMVDMARKDILPAVERYTAEVASSATAKRQLVPDCACGFERRLVSRLSQLTDAIDLHTEELEAAMNRVRAMTDITAEANAIRDQILPKMAELRAAADEAETLTDARCWPYPSCGKLLFGVK